MARPKQSHSTRRRMLALARKTETLLEKVDVDEHLMTDLDVRLIRDRHKLASTLLKALKGTDAAKQKRYSNSPVRF